ncbi:hypothetical protein BCR43DRAFT_488723 [Syncephalastrum racemosum]|uniref:Uncharacterized protein n=1 Tax=Syncephalastrum racemosum TaxID=13706 RepID=A0A1X2HJ63_SYNRA|nr:hypothetical protein BCR43DRAFT_488723 [Syncephalastrum racemosum]
MLCIGLPVLLSDADDDAPWSVLRRPNPCGRLRHVSHRSQTWLNLEVNSRVFWPSSCFYFRCICVCMHVCIGLSGANRLRTRSA